RTRGVGTVSGPGAVRQWLGTQLELADGVATRVGDVLALRLDALLLRLVISGIERSGGGPYERHFLRLGTFGADGLWTRVEQFDADREAEALARFDELAAQAQPVVRRRVRPNVATAFAAHFDAVIAMQDADALPALFCDGPSGVDHMLHMEWDRHAALSAWRSLALAEDPRFRHEPLAALGHPLS